MGGSKADYGPPVCDRVGRLGRFEAVFYFAGEAMGMADREGRLVDINPAFGDLLGLGVRDIIGRTLPDLFDVSAAEAIGDAIMKLGVETTSGTDTIRLDVRFTHSDGSHRWAALTMTHVIDNEAPCLLVVGIDITWRRELRTQLYNQARHDPLTSLPNRIYLQERLDHVLSDPNRTVGACLADLDGFKKVNDAHGHGTGDRLLIAIASELRHDTPGHMVGRIGGDEFLTLVVDPAGMDTLIEVADGMLAASRASTRSTGTRSPSRPASASSFPSRRTRRWTPSFAPPTRASTRPKRRVAVAGALPCSTAKEEAMARHSVQVRRVYDPPQPDDGQRILVDRLWPRGISKDRAQLDDWPKEIAPSNELREWYGHDPDRYDEFARRYRAELADSQHAPTVAQLRERVGHGRLTLLTGAKRSDISEASVLVDVLTHSAGRH